MLAEIQWILIPALLLMLSALLLWGLRRRPMPSLEAQVEEILSDDPPPEPPPQPRPEPVHLSSELMQHRRLLLRLLGPDTPDLLVSLWVDPEDPRLRHVSYHQVFLPAGLSAARLGARIEQELFDGAEADGVPPGSRLSAACAFVHQWERRSDLVVYSYFDRTEMSHSFFRPDPDGKLVPVDDVGASPFVPLVRHDEWWTAKRQAQALLPGRDAEAWGQIAAAARLRLAENFQDAGEHAWFAIAEHRRGGDGRVAAKHLSLALEFSAGNLPARAERARLEGEEALAACATWLHACLREESDDPVAAGHLLCGALEVLWQTALARALSDSLLAAYPRHPEAGRLRRLSGSETPERGAQA